MSSWGETTEWAFPERLQPRQENLRFNLEAALQSVVQVHSEVPDEAFTASVLGTERMDTASSSDPTGSC